jgi:hypothetical protein
VRSQGGGRPFSSLTPEQKKEHRAAVWRGIECSDPKTASLVVETCRDTTRRAVPRGIALGAGTTLCSLLLFVRGADSWFFTLTLCVGVLGVVFWTVVGLLAIRAIRRNVPTAEGLSK